MVPAWDGKRLDGLFYLYPVKFTNLFDKLTDFYCRVLERGKSELAADGLFISDDIGTQKPLFFVGYFS